MPNALLVVLAAAIGAVTLYALAQVVFRRKTKVVVIDNARLVWGRGGTGRGRLVLTGDAPREAAAGGRG